MHAQQPLAASALAGGNPTALPSKRRLDVCIRLKRAWGALFAKWCKEANIRITERLPWGTMARFHEDQGGASRGLPDKQLINFARAYARNAYSTCLLPSQRTQHMGVQDAEDLGVLGAPSRQQVCASSCSSGSA